LVDPTAELHRQLGLYPGLGLKLPALSASQSAWLNLMLMCAGLGSPGTLAEVFRGYRGDRRAPQLIGDDEVVQAAPLPPLRGSFFRWAGGRGFQRPFELATLRLRNMAEALGHWSTYVPDATYLTQRGATFLFDRSGTLLYEHRDRGILGFAANMSDPLSFLATEQPTV
ncbi:MAG TPA: AhpC/TSA family protein, partial [Chroococcidiopsis sp.]